MALKHKCTGTQTIINWTLPAGSCIYQVQLSVDGTPITNAVALNNTMTTTQIAALLNSNRINNTTGTITVQLSGANLVITINDIILGPSEGVSFLVSVLGTGDPCPDFTLQQASITCSTIRTGGGGRANSCILHPEICTPKRLYPNGPMPTLLLKECNVMYFYSHEKGDYYCYILDAKLATERNSPFNKTENQIKQALIEEVRRVKGKVPARIKCEQTGTGSNFAVCCTAYDAIGVVLGIKCSSGTLRKK